MAFSVVCGLACLLFVGLWVRTFFACDNLRLEVANQGVAIVTSRQGGLGGGFFDVPQVTVSEWNYSSHPPDTRPTVRYSERLGFGVYWPPGKNTFVARAPYWSLILIAGILCWALAKKVAWQFSLRSLLVVMTLVAVGLGAIVFATR
jgi:hypothetical protein